MSVASRTWPVWSTTAEVLVTEPARLDSACAILKAYLAAIGDACDRFSDDSELMRVRGRAADGIEVSPVLADLVEVALDVAEATGGAVDPTLGRELRRAGYDRDIRLVVDDSGRVTEATRPAAPWRRVRVEGDLLVVPDDLELDLGATAKARTADLAAGAIAATCGCGVLVNLGGDLTTRGDAPAEGWQVTVQDLPDEPSCQVSVPSDFALATSSTLRRIWRRGGQGMHHILDPWTSLPAAPVWRTVSVAAPTAVTANGLTTAAIVHGGAALERLASAGWPARLVGRAGDVTLLNEWPEEARAA